MKLTKSKLKQIIQEEIQNIVDEDAKDATPQPTPHPGAAQFIARAKEIHRTVGPACGIQAQQLVVTLGVAASKPKLYMPKAAEQARVLYTCTKDYKVEELAQDIAQAVDAGNQQHTEPEKDLAEDGLFGA